jgi:hypothetical protein
MPRVLLRNGIRPQKRKDYTPEKHASRITLIDKHFIARAEGDYEDSDAARLANRLSRHRDEGSRSWAKSQHAFSLLFKSFETGELLTTIRAALDAPRPSPAA